MRNFLILLRMGCEALRITDFFCFIDDGNIKSKFIYYYDKQKLKMILLDKDNDGGFDKKLVKLSNGKIDLYINRNGKWEISKIQKGKDYKFLFNVQFDKKYKTGSFIKVPINSKVD